MTETVVAVEPSQNPEDEAAVAAIDVPENRVFDELEVARELVRQAREAGVTLTGPGGLLKAMTKTVIETALDEELAEHLGYDRHDPGGYGRGNSRNGTRSKTVLTDACGAIEIDVPRDRAGTFEPQIVKKRQRRLTDVDEVVLSLYARGLTTGEISAHFADIYDAQVCKDTISRITDRVVEAMTAWHTRPLERVYAAVFIDALHVKIREGQVGPRPVYAAIGVDLAGHRDVLLMARAGLRRGELCGLRRSDVHLLADSRVLGCEMPRAHLHVVRRENPMQHALAGSRPTPTHCRNPRQPDRPHRRGRTRRLARRSRRTPDQPRRSQRQTRPNRPALNRHRCRPRPAQHTTPENLMDATPFLVQRSRSRPHLPLRHRDLLERIHAAETQPPDKPEIGPSVTRTSLQADLLAAQHRCTRMAARTQRLEARLSELLGEQAWRATGLGAPTDIDQPTSATHRHVGTASR
jgi:putative transposase